MTLLTISFTLKPHPPLKLDHHFLGVSLLRFSNLQISKGFLRLFWQWGLGVLTMETPSFEIKILWRRPKSCLLTMSRAWCWFSPISFIGVNFVIKRKDFQESKCFLGLIFPFLFQIRVMDFEVFDTYAMML